MKALAGCVCIRKCQACFPSICVPTQGRGELNGKKLNPASPWKNLTRSYLLTSESLDRNYSHKYSPAQPCVNTGDENKSLKETTQQRKPQSFPVTLSLSACEAAALCLTHAGKHRPEDSDKAHAVIPPSVFLLGGAILSHRSHHPLCRKTKKPHTLHP